MLRLALVLCLGGCGADSLFQVGEGDASVDISSRIDSGRVTPDSGVSVEDAGRRKIAWVRVPSTGGAIAAPRGGHKMQVRLPPPTSHGESSGATHDVRSALGGNR